MKKPLSRISDTFVTCASMLCMVLLLGLYSAESAFGETQKIREEKTIKFSHLKHVKDAGIECVDCHKAATTSKLSSDNLRSSHENCQSCHEDQLNKTCTFCHTSENQDTYQAKEPPDRKLVFSHEFHLGKEKMECITCHQNVPEADDEVTIHVPKMTICNTCHNDAKASNYCEGCHTDLSSLRPKEHNRTNFVREHKIEARLSTQTCSTCHTQESCLDCHSGSDLQKSSVKGGDLVSPRSPRLMAIDRGQGNRLIKVHDANFKMTHGVSAKSKMIECQTCHEQKTFCSTCHEAGGNVNQSGFRPDSHAKADFIRLGIGSGGGQHATLAKRDIETCASCHDAEGADPACVHCHTDADGIKGTDPKTHTRGFMASNNGEWHTDPGSTCYMCHNDANARVGGIKGRNFCGYCHK
ncbi:MAG: hypothetical protein V1799_00360 [bacterium]